MVIPGTSLNTSYTALTGRRDPVQSQNAERTNSNSQSGPSTNSQVAEVQSRDGVQVAAPNSTAFQPTRQSNQGSRLGQNRNNPADIEALSNQFRLQRENESTNSAIRTFQSIADFERQDNLRQTTGIDIFV